MASEKYVHGTGRVCEWFDGVWIIMHPERSRPIGGSRCNLEHEVGDAPLTEPGGPDFRPGKLWELPGSPIKITNGKCTITERGIDFDFGEQGYEVEAATDDARFVLSVLPSIIEQFLEKNRKYASVQDGYDLGAQGVIPDINRKVGILIDRIWREREEVGEGTDEVISDAIGHLLLLLAKRAAT